MTACAVRQSMREAIRRGRWLRRICLHGSILSLDLRDLYPHWLSRASHVLRRPSWPCTERAVSRYVRKVKIRTRTRNGIAQYMYTTLVLRSYKYKGPGRPRAGDQISIIYPFLPLSHIRSGPAQDVKAGAQTHGRHCDSFFY